MASEECKKIVGIPFSYMFLPPPYKALRTSAEVSWEQLKHNILVFRITANMSMKHK